MLGAKLVAYLLPLVLIVWIALIVLGILTAIPPLHLAGLLVVIAAVVGVSFAANLSLVALLSDLSAARPRPSLASGLAGMAATAAVLLTHGGAAAWVAARAGGHLPGIAGHPMVGVSAGLCAAGVWAVVVAMFRAAARRIETFDPP